MEMNMDALSAELGTGEPMVPEVPAEDIKIKLGETEYTQDQLNELVGLANNVREQEKKYNTKFDSVWPAYGQSQQKLKQLEKDLEEAKAPKAPQPTVDEAEMVRQARAEAKRLGLLTEDDLKERGIITEKDFQRRYELQRATEKIMEQADNLEKEIDGKDGRPAFKKEEIVDYMAATGFRDMNAAYRDKFEKELDAWKEAKLASARKPGMDTIMDGGVSDGTNKKPADVKVTRDNLGQMLQEALEGKF